MTTSGPRVSILLPVWNAESTLETCLRSIERQSESDFECVLVDDGSTDRSLDVARNRTDRDPRFRVFAEPHEGLVPSLVKGTAHCRGDYIARIDADDWMHHDRLRLQCAALENQPELDAVGSFVRIFPRQLLSDGRRAYEEWLHSLSDPQTIWRNRFIECPVVHPTLMIRSEALAQTPYRDRAWPEDYDLMLRLLRKGPKVGMVTRRLVGWRDNAKRLSRTHANYGQESFTACRAWHLSRDFLRNHRRYVLWGHGRTGRALRKALMKLGHDPELIVDVHPRRIGQRIRGAEVIRPEALDQHRELPIVVSVAHSAPRAEIRSALESMGFRDGVDYVSAA
jgi:glycosyltransferase involved in cell wall biosynthesis